MAQPALTETGSWPVQEPCRGVNGMIASVNPLASAAGLQVLQDGGNALDAAIAAGAVLTVVEPWSGQLGGDAFMLIFDGKTGKTVALNGSGRSPRAASLERYRSEGGIPEAGWLAASVPGLVDAWEVAVQAFGTRPLGALLEAAVHYAENGFPLTARQARTNREMAPISRHFKDTARVLLPGGQPPEAGELFRQPDLGGTLHAIQREGSQVFYRGEIAEAIVEASAKGGGLFSLQDLADQKTLIFPPISLEYRGRTILEQPPVSQGMIVLMSLGVLEDFRLDEADLVDFLHLQIEAHKLALLERVAWLGDPDFVQIPELLSKPRLKSLADRLDPGRASPLPAPVDAHADTTYLCVVDSDRNAVSYIHSLYGGNAVIAGQTGVLLNNRMGCFSLDPTSPNRLEPGKRPIHTLNSWMVLEGDRLHTLGGTPGSFWQVQTNLQILTQLIDRGSRERTAVDAPRWTMGPQTDWSGSRLSLEDRFQPEVFDRLRERGHDVQAIGPWAAGGAAQVIAIEGRTLVGAGDPRPKTSSVLAY